MVFMFDVIDITKVLMRSADDQIGEALLKGWVKLLWYGTKW